LAYSTLAADAVLLPEDRLASVWEAFPQVGEQQRLLAVLVGDDGFPVGHDSLTVVELLEFAKKRHC